ncbi:zf-HC2 domain-containing protein [Microbacterium lacusdiani]
MSDHDALAEWDAAYVLGALTPADRRRFEAHLEECARCRAAVGELVPIPGLLARAGAPDAAPPAPPADLLDRMRERERRRVRGVRARIAGWAAAAAVALALAIGVPAAMEAPDEPDVTVALESAAMSVEVGLEPVAWGTRLVIRCEYPDAGYGYGAGAGYALVVTDVDGRSEQVSTWGAMPGRAVELEAATSLPVERIASLAVRAEGGDILMSVPVPREG